MNDQKPGKTTAIPEQTRDARRTLVLAVAILLLAGSGLVWWLDEKGISTFASAAMGRIGLVLLALWLAWPSLRRPARWLPPGVAALGVLALAVLAANPRLVVVIIPALGVLLALAAIVRAVRGRQ